MKKLLKIILEKILEVLFTILIFICSIIIPLYYSIKDKMKKLFKKIKLKPINIITNILTTIVCMHVNYINDIPITPLLIFVWIYVTIFSIIGIGLKEDIESRNDLNPFIWYLLICIFGPIALIIYLRKKHD